MTMNIAGPDESISIGSFLAYAIMSIKPCRDLGFGATLPAYPGEVAEFYWSTDLPAKEIARAYGISNSPQMVAREAGPGILAGCLCFSCKGAIIVKNRTEAKEKIDRYENPPYLWHEDDWRRQLLCRSCENSFYENERRERELQEQAKAEHQHRLRYMPYREYLKSEHWQGVRQQALRRAGYKCQLCNSSRPLQVHHRTYERRGCEWPEDVIALCADCHGQFHQKLTIKTSIQDREAESVINQAT